MERTELEQRILEMPEKIRKANLAITEKTLELARLDSKIADRETTAMQVVLNEKVDGKDKHTNDKARNIAQKTLLASDKDYQQWLVSHNDETTSLAYVRVDYETANNTFKALLAIAGVGK